MFDLRAINTTTKWCYLDQINTNKSWAFAKMLICLIALVHFNRQFLFYISSICTLPGNRYTMFVPSNAAISSLDASYIQKLKSSYTYARRKFLYWLMSRLS